jgi:hypothetical protein
MYHGGDKRIVPIGLIFKFVKILGGQKIPDSMKTIYPEDV